jgi:hypothetical protein
MRKWFIFTMHIGMYRSVDKCWCLLQLLRILVVTDHYQASMINTVRITNFFFQRCQVYDKQIPLNRDKLVPCNLKLSITGIL